MKTMRGTWVVLSSVFVAACVETHVGLGNDGNDGASGDTAALVLPDNGPRGNAALEYGFCSINYGTTLCMPGWNGHPAGAIAHGSPEDTGGTSCYCPRGCAVDTECPVPESGTSAPVCGTMSGDRTCLLPCDAGQTCPDGMFCSEVFDTTGAVCVWHEDDTRNVHDNASVCEALTTREACEALLSEYPVPANYRCAWASEQMISRDDVTCAAPTEIERCIAVEAGDGFTAPGTGWTGCPPDGTPSCDGTQNAPVYYLEAAASDVSLLTLESCAYRPWLFSGDQGFCDFTADPAVPSVCACACAASR